MQNFFYKNEDYFLRREAKRCENWSFIEQKETPISTKLLKFGLYACSFSLFIYIGFFRPM